MLESSVKFLRCAGCASRLELDTFLLEKEIEEGTLECSACGLVFPVVGRVPILWDDFAGYLSSRRMLGGRLYGSAKTKKMKGFLKSTMSDIAYADDRTAIEDRWCKIYRDSRNSRFYSVVRKRLGSVPRSGLVLEHGCSVGTMTSALADSHGMVFGVDRSFAAISHAKTASRDNLDYVVADSLSPVFGKLRFGLVLALNVLELIEPLDLLRHASGCTDGHLVVSDPYDFERGNDSVRRSLDESSLRTCLKNLGFEISRDTRRPSFIPWSLKLGPRTTLNYRTDLVVGKKGKKRL